MYNNIIGGRSGLGGVLFWEHDGSSKQNPSFILLKTPPFSPMMVRWDFFCVYVCVWKGDPFFSF